MCMYLDSLLYTYLGFSCPVCSKYFAHKSKLMRHLNTAKHQLFLYSTKPDVEEVDSESIVSNHVDVCLVYLIGINHNLIMHIG